MQYNFILKYTSAYFDQLRSDSLRVWGQMRRGSGEKGRMNTSNFSICKTMN